MELEWSQSRKTKRTTCKPTLLISKSGIWPALIKCSGCKTDSSQTAPSFQNCPTCLRSCQASKQNLTPLPASTATFKRALATSTLFTRCLLAQQFPWCPSALPCHISCLLHTKGDTTLKAFVLCKSSWENMMTCSCLFFNLGPCGLRQGCWGNGLSKTRLIWKFLNQQKVRKTSAG